MRKLLHNFIKKWHEKKEKNRIKRIRTHLAFFGCDTSYLSDEEIATGLVKISEVIAESGFKLQDIKLAFESKPKEEK